MCVSSSYLPPEDLYILEDTTSFLFGLGREQEGFMLLFVWATRTVSAWGCCLFRICFYPPVPGRELLLPLQIMKLDHLFPYQFALLAFLAFSRALCTPESVVSLFLGHIWHRGLAKRHAVACFCLFICASLSSQQVCCCPQSQCAFTKAADPSQGLALPLPHPTTPHPPPTPLPAVMDFKSSQLW